MTCSASDFRSWRLLPSMPAPGSWNMALDAALLHAASSPGFPPTLRFMQWEPPALSLGRFQPVELVDFATCRQSGIDVVRRPTGGEAVLHKDEFTYTVVLPVDMEVPDSVLDAYEMICRAVIEAFGRLGLEVRLLRRGIPGEETDGSCFARPGVSDLVHGKAKVCGSAQARRRGGLLQHGSILLRDNADLLYRLLRLPEEQRALSKARFRAGCLSLEDTGLHPSRAQMEEAFRAGFSKAFGISLQEALLTRREAQEVESRRAEFALLEVGPDRSCGSALQPPCPGFMLE